MGYSSLMLLLLLLLTTTTAMPAASPPLPREQLNKIIDALIGAGDFNSWAKMLAAAGEEGATVFPVWATFFVPSSDSDYSSLSMDRIVLVMGYHIVPQRLLFSQLRLLKPLTRLPTLLPTKSILITNTSISNFTIDDSLLSHPDLYVTSSFAVHGIQTLLNYSIYGSANSSFTPPHPPPPRPPPPPPPQAEFRIGSSGAACSLWWEVFFLVVFGVCIVMIQDLMVV